MAEEKDTTLEEDNVVKAIKEEYEAKIKVIQEEAEADKKKALEEQEEHHIRQMRALLSGREDIPEDNQVTEEEELLSKVKKRFNL